MYEPKGISQIIRDVYDNIAGAYKEGFEQGKAEAEKRALIYCGECVYFRENHSCWATGICNLKPDEDFCSLADRKQIF